MTTSLSHLITQRIEAKRIEDAAAAARKSIDLKIAELFRPAVDGEGSVSEKLEGLAKVTVKFGTARKVDSLQLKARWEGLPARVQACFKFDADVILPNLRALDADDSLTASNFITSKPSSPAVTVELL